MLYFNPYSFNFLAEKKKQVQNDYWDVLRFVFHNYTLFIAVDTVLNKNMLLFLLVLEENFNKHMWVLCSGVHI